ncbi:MAG: hypothetical protein IPK87_12640 [Planctomycetes bacterium]|nr:hypothetical protein [Planctomycetota bacterium]
MRGRLADAALARIPAQALSLLAGLRGERRILVRLDGSTAWVRWDAPGAEVVRALLPAAGAEFFELVGDSWRPCGRLIHTPGVPADGFLPLESVLLPAAFAHAISAPALPAAVAFSLVPLTTPQPASALFCSAADLAAWADMAPQRSLEQLRGARSGGSVLVMGGHELPTIPGRRFWGERLLVPLGFGPHPDLPESTLLEALEVPGDCLAIATQSALEIVPLNAFAPLTRASARLGAA